MDPSAYTFEEPEERDYYTFPKGKYKWRILEINDITESKNGNAMLPIKFEFYDDQGRTSPVYENLVFIEAAKFKIDQFLKCCSGQMAPGRKISFTDPEVLKWLKARTGEANLEVEDVPGKTYKRNKITGFVYSATTISGTTVSTPPAKQQPPSAPADEEEDLDSIPF